MEEVSFESFCLDFYQRRDTIPKKQLIINLDQCILPLINFKEFKIVNIGSYIKDEFEFDVFTLDDDLLSIFLYLSFGQNFLTKPRVDYSQLSYFYMILFENFYDEFNLMENKFPLYIYKYDKYEFLWSPFMCTRLKYFKHKMTVRDPIPIVSEPFVTPIEDLMLLANALLSSKYEFNSKLQFNHWELGPLMLTGTACVGKTSLIQKIADTFNLPKTKTSMFGGFKNKDTCQILGLLNQAAGFSIENSGFSVCDRFPFDNLIWLIIMSLIGNDFNMILFQFEQMLKAINPNIFSCYKNKPWIVILEANPTENRKRMLQRNNGGDSFRAFIPYYVELQNMVYGVFAALCGIQMTTIDILYENEGDLFNYIDICKTNLPTTHLVKQSNINLDVFQHFDLSKYRNAYNLSILK